MPTRASSITVAVFVLSGLLLAPTRATAQVVHDSQLWTQAIVTAGLSSHWLVHLEGQPRWSGDISELNQIIARTAVGRRLNDRLTVWGGYAWVPRTAGEGVRHEQRIWQQLSATFPSVAQWAPSLRVRVEQRFLGDWADTSHRVRLMGRAVRPLDDTRAWSLVGWNELMLTLDETARGPWQGVDQNRLFGGILRRLNPKVSVEGGYLWHTTDSPTAPRAHSHVTFVWLNVTM